MDATHKNGHWMQLGHPSLYSGIMYEFWKLVGKRLCKVIETLPEGEAFFTLGPEKEPGLLGGAVSRLISSGASNHEGTLPISRFSAGAGVI
jgi:hypothetical protein